MEAYLAARVGDAVGAHASLVGTVVKIAVAIATGIAVGLAIAALASPVGWVAIGVTAGIAIGTGATVTAISARLLERADHARAPPSQACRLHPHLDGSACGKIEAGSPNTLVERRSAARADLDRADHGADVHITQGSATVLVNQKPLARENDAVACGGKVLHGCERTWVGGRPSADTPGPSDAALERLSTWAGRLAIGAFVGAAALPLWPILAGGNLLAGLAYGATQAITFLGASTLLPLLHTRIARAFGENTADWVDMGLAVGGGVFAARVGAKALSPKETALARPLEPGPDEFVYADGEARVQGRATTTAEDGQQILTLDVDRVEGKPGPSFHQNFGRGAVANAREMGADVVRVRAPDGRMVELEVTPGPPPEGAWVGPKQLDAAEPAGAAPKVQLEPPATGALKLLEAGDGAAPAPGALGATAAGRAAAPTSAAAAPPQSPVRRARVFSRVRIWPKGARRDPFGDLPGSVHYPMDDGPDGLNGFSVEQVAYGRSYAGYVLKEWEQVVGDVEKKGFEGFRDRYGDTTSNIRNFRDGFTETQTEVTAARGLAGALGTETDAHLTNIAANAARGAPPETLPYGSRYALVDARGVTSGSIEYLRDAVEQGQWEAIVSRRMDDGSERTLRVRRVAASTEPFTPGPDHAALVRILTAMRSAAAGAERELDAMTKRAAALQRRTAALQPKLEPRIRLEARYRSYNDTSPEPECLTCRGSHVRPGGLPKNYAELQRISHAEAVAKVNAFMRSHGVTENPSPRRFRFIGEFDDSAIDDHNSPAGRFPLPGDWSSVDIHGNPHAFAETNKSGAVARRFGPEQLADELVARGYRGGPLRLNSCSTGKAPGGPRRTWKRSFFTGRLREVPLPDGLSQRFTDALAKRLAAIPGSEPVAVIAPSEPKYPDILAPNSRNKPRGRWRAYFPQPDPPAPPPTPWERLSRWLSGDRGPPPAPDAGDALAASSRTMAEVEPIHQQRDQSIKTRRDLASLVEEPALPAAEDLYDRNVRTIDTNAHGHGGTRTAALVLDYDSLSPENQAIARRIGRVGPNPDGGSAVTLEAPFEPSTPVRDVQAKLRALARQLRPQRLDWAGLPERQLARLYASSPGEYTPAAWESVGWFYDAVTERYYRSVELRDKATRAARQQNGACSTCARAPQPYGGDRLR